MFYTLMALITYLSWTYIHEGAHLLALKRFKEVTSWTIKPYPHKHPELGFVYGSVNYEYKGILTLKQDALVSIAPRVPNLIGCVLFCVNTGSMYWDIFFAGAVVDLIRGSLPLRETSDICRYSKGFKIPMFDLAITQMFFAALILYIKMLTLI